MCYSVLMTVVDLGQNTTAVVTGVVAAVVVSKGEVDII